MYIISRSLLFCNIIFTQSVVLFPMHVLKCLSSARRYLYHYYLFTSIKAVTAAIITLPLVSPYSPENLHMF
jgi:hypothetical protein